MSEQLVIEIDSSKAVAAIDQRIKEFKDSRFMRAKMRVASIQTWEGSTQETLKFNAVCKSDGYPADGSDEDNSFARWTPSGELTLAITNPALHGKFTVGDKFYLDFTPTK